jgi:hypothetical protein
VEDNWGGYRIAGFSVELPDGWCYVRPDLPGVTEGVYPWDNPSVFITGWNPNGSPRSETKNREAEQLLAGALSNDRIVPAVGGIPNGPHLEPGWLVLDANLERVRAVARDFGQDAVYLWHHDRLELVACRSEAREILGWTRSTL